VKQPAARLAFRLGLGVGIIVGAWLGLLLSWLCRVAGTG
jgi:hypothetical protein